MADGGIPVSVGGSSDCTSLSGDLSTITVGHVWISANGNLYDPSYKTHILSSGIDIPAAMGCGTRTSSTCGAALLRAGLTGASSGTETSGPDAGLGYVQNINQTAIAAQLQAAAVGVQTAIQGANRLAHIQDVVGGGRLVITHHHRLFRVRCPTQPVPSSRSRETSRISIVRRSRLPTDRRHQTLAVFSTRTNWPDIDFWSIIRRRRT